MEDTPIVVRELYLPREPVFDAWTQAEHLAQWFAPEDCRVEEVVVEAEVGGRFEVAWRDAAGRLARESGRFTEVTAPAGFVCALHTSWERSPDREPGPHDSRSGDRSHGTLDTRLGLELEDRVDTCRLVLREAPTDGGSGAPEPRRRQWEERLDRLEAYFSAI